MALLKYLPMYPGVVPGDIRPPLPHVTFCPSNGLPQNQCP